MKQWRRHISMYILVLTLTIVSQGFSAENLQLQTSVFAVG